MAHTECDDGVWGGRPLLSTAIAIHGWAGHHPWVGWETFLFSMSQTNKKIEGHLVSSFSRWGNWGLEKWPFPRKPEGHFKHDIFPGVFLVRTLTRQSLLPSCLRIPLVDPNASFREPCSGWLSGLILMRYVRATAQIGAPNALSPYTPEWKAVWQPVLFLGKHYKHGPSDSKQHLPLTQSYIIISLSLPFSFLLFLQLSEI